MLLACESAILSVVLNKKTAIRSIDSIEMDRSSFTLSNRHVGLDARISQIPFAKSNACIDTPYLYQSIFAVNLLVSSHLFCSPSTYMGTIPYYLTSRR
jgi:hypothetical protein